MAGRILWAQHSVGLVQRLKDGPGFPEAPAWMRLKQLSHEALGEVTVPSSLTGFHHITMAAYLK